jgi:hypothetical protein
MCGWQCGNAADHRRRRIAREQPIEASGDEQQPKPEERPSADAPSQRRQRAKRKGKKPREKIEQIPWHVRLAACRHLLDRSYGKPFQSKSSTTKT